jgi:serine/threonine protein kinase
MDYRPARNNYMHKQRIKARHTARRSSDDFCETYGYSALDSVAPFESEEIILGRRLGSGSFSVVYDIQHINLRPDQLNVYPKDLVHKREAIAKAINNGNQRFVIKCLKEEVEESDDDAVFLDAAKDIMHEAEMLAVLSHPNIIKLHGIIASRHDAFLGGSSAFFIILERLESTLNVNIDTWASQKNSFAPSRPLKSLGNSLSSSSKAVDKIEKTDKPNLADGGRYLDSRLQVCASLAGAMEYLHSQDVIFRDLKPNNVGFDKEGNVKLFDFGLSKFMPRDVDCYSDVFEMSGAGTPRYTAAEVIFYEPYNLKADVYTFSVILWEMMSLKTPFAKYKYRNEFDKAISRGETLDISRKWPLPIQNIIRRSLSRDISERPTMSEISIVLNTCVSKGVTECETDSSMSTASASASSFPPKLSANWFFAFRKFSSSWGSNTSKTAATQDTAFEDLLEEVQELSVSRIEEG